MLCPYCQHCLEHPVTRLRRQRRLDGKCIDCKAPLNPAERYSRCRACRVKIAARARAKRNP